MGIVLQDLRQWKSAASMGALLAGSMLSGVPSNVRAQIAPASSARPAVDAPAETSGDIIVTARKSSERELDVPITISVLSAEAIQSRGVMSFQDIANISPGVQMGVSPGALGAAIAIRGMGTAAASPNVDQSVAFAVDSITMTNAFASRFGTFDIAQVEVLRGPQSLYYGRNAVAGIIAVTTADPKNHFEAMAQAGYEFNSNATNLDAYISGPLTDTLRARIAATYGSFDGFFKNPDLSGKPGFPAGYIVRGPNADTVFEGDKVGLRGTLIWEPSDRFSAKIKGTWYRTDTTNPYDQMVFMGCGAGNVRNPAALGNYPSLTSCDYEHDGGAAVMGGSRGPTPTERPEIPWLRSDGEQYELIKQTLLTAQLDYKLTDTLNLASTTSYFKLDQNSVAGPAGPSHLLVVYTDLSRREVAQELRISSDFSGPFNFMAGVFGQNTDSYIRVPIQFATGFNGNALSDSRINIKTRSVFGQARYKFLSDLELSAGGRYIDETHEFTPTVFLTGAPLPNGVPQQTFKSFTPEVTLAWKAGPRANIFLSYKQGRKSGGYNIPSTTLSFGPLETFGQEKVSGFELGGKTIVADGAVRIDGALYHYTYDDMQVGSFDPATAVVTISNAAKAKAYGAELAVSYEPPAIDGLNLTLRGNYSHAQFEAGASTGCWTGQSIVQGCNLGLNPVTGRYTLQDLKGQQLPRASEWTGNFDVRYERSISNALQIGLGGTLGYLSSFFPTTDYAPVTKQGSQVTLDSQIRLFDEEAKWELALIGKNLTQTRYVPNAFPRPSTGQSALTGTASGGMPADYRGVAFEPRTIMLRLTKRW